MTTSSASAVNTSGEYEILVNTTIHPDSRVADVLQDVLAYVSEEAAPGDKLYYEYEHDSGTDSWGAACDYYTIRWGEKVITWRLENVDSCCALATMSRLSVSYAAFNDREFMRLMGEAFAPLLRMYDVCKVQFGLSEEEVSRQYSSALEFGFVDAGEPFRSYKTGNMIHTMHLDLMDDDDHQQAEDEHENNSMSDDWYDDEDDDGDW